MNKIVHALGLGVLLIGIATTARAATVITANTAINPLNLAYDGADLVISNCTVTMDGPHTFSSLLVGPGGVLTHSDLPTGGFVLTIGVTNELQTLIGNTPATLLNSNVQGLVTVTDTNSVITYSNGVDYIQASLPNGTTQIYATTNSAIPTNATVLVSYTWNYDYSAGLFVTVSNDVTVAIGGAINANGIGYGPGLGPGAGTETPNNPAGGNGGGHGGGGGYSLNFGGNAGAGYDSLYQPVKLGSGGGGSYAGNGGSGGGLVQINAGGNANIYGALSANGNAAANDRAGGGAGGSIWIAANSLTGSGALAANGGAGELPYGGGGGGGRIAIQCVSNLFSGTLAAMGGNGYQNGGAGTVYTQVVGTNGLLVMDNGGLTNTFSTVTLGTLTDVIIRNGAKVQPFGQFLPNNLTIGAASTLAGNYQLFNLSVAGNAWIQSGGLITVDGQGYKSGLGTAPGGIYSVGGPPYPCGGGGHGGYGAAGSNPGAFGGATYGSQTAPLTFGSGGGGSGSTSMGGYGGGAIELSVNGTLQVDGRLSANGWNYLTGGGGGGAGGSVYVASCGLLAGAGSITANGGSAIAAFGGGGGGGGHIAIYPTSSSFTGTMTAYGGAGVSYGGAGTIYTQINSSAGPSQPQLLIDNGGNSGTNTTIASASTANLIVQNGARGVINGTLAFNSLLVTSNAWLTDSSTGAATLTISGNATFQAGGGFVADGLGRTSGTGFAPGFNSFTAPYFAGGGGAYGGSGGNSLSNAASGGYNSGDSPANPSSAYSGSGGGGYSTSIGGSGGGFLQMNVNGALQLNGLLSANGGPGGGPGGGGGAGGGIYLSVKSFAGAGAISVNGGAGANGYGGGGGGGRIAVYFNTNSFTGTLAAFGGAGANYGGAGSIYFKTNFANNGQVIADNAGHAGGYTFWYSSPGTDLTLRNNAGCFISASPSFGNVVVGSNSWLSVSNAQSGQVSVNANSLNIQLGGVVSADSAGSFPNSGSGSGGTSSLSPYYSGGGGGHGGGGGFSISNAAAGGTYFDNELSPSLSGGGGGGSAPNSTGGRGGGNLYLKFNGNLQVDGLLSANGGNGSGVGGGGGAGGTVNIGCTILSGAGTIAANGGNGVGTVGGGGGGGMIYAGYTSNVFSGLISAYGGGGANYGGAGSIYFRTNSTGQTLLIADNGGHRGTNTPLASANNWIIRNGATAFAQNNGQTLASLLINSNGWLLSSSIPAGLSLNLFINGNATIQAGGGILGDGLGYPQNNGNGRGPAYSLYPYFPGGGGGHGGFGGNASTNSPSGPINSSGGTTYDSSASPSSIGSGGGGSENYSFGGNGGGYVSLYVGGTLQLNGSISVNGLNGTGLGGGGGSGGGIYISRGALTGNGTITANGGSGADVYGGGGGGGRIALNLVGDSFSGSISARGGGGGAYGGAGTIFIRTNGQNYGQVILDNGGNAGTNTTFDNIVQDASVQNNAIGTMPTRAWTAHNIFIHTNSALTAQPSSAAYSLTANNLTIDPGGVVNFDGAGNTSQAGTGPGGQPANTVLGGGGGHGGYGGGNPPGSGIAYDSIVAPVLPGSGGANYTYNGYTSPGGYGGGALQLTVNGTLTVNGRISANGAGGAYVAGGGSGGSLYFPFINLLAGNGMISANGGSTNSQSAGGGGGGGRIALYAANSTFTGRLSAYGGNGPLPGGAGTVFSSISGYQRLTIDNGSLVGTNTPVGTGFFLPNPPFDLNVSNDADAVALSPLPIINNLNLGTGSTLSGGFAQSNLFLAVKNNFNLSGNLLADSLGYGQTNGPGSGTSIYQTGSGGGYGGIGGNSADGAPGGTTYGSASQPTDFGSGGGNGAYFGANGSEGGGAIRLSVGGVLNLNGIVSANGDFAQQDNAGGGSGGSIWIAANSLSGSGTVSASGGNGDPNNGGGGGGGRVAIYSPTNLFAGTTNVTGGLGNNDGQPGTVFFSSALLSFLAVSQSPTGVVNNTVSSAAVFFNDAIDPASVSAAAFTVTTPAGTIAPSNVTVSVTGLSSVQINFPLQNLLGNYSIQVTPTVTNILGEPLAAPFTGNFSISLPTISGTVSDTNGNPVAGVLIQPTGGLIAATTDTNGNYSIGVPSGWNGTLTPSFATDMFVPGSLAFTSVNTSLTNRNFLMVSTIMPTLAASLNPTNQLFLFTWNGIPGVTYQVWSSPDLVNWTVYGAPISGTTGLMQAAFAITPGTPALFFRLGATN